MAASDARYKLTTEQVFFVLWLASPSKGQGNLPKDYTAYAEMMGVSTQTLRDWRKNPNVKGFYEELLQEIIDGPMAEIIKNLCERAKGDVKDASVFLKHFAPKVGEEEGSRKVVVEVDFGKYNKQPEEEPEEEAPEKGAEQSG